MKDTQQDNEIIDLGKARAKRTEERRKNVERIIFRNLMGVYSVVENGELAGVQLVDVSKDGLAFQVPYHPMEQVAYEKGQEVLLRLYFGPDSFLPASVEIRYSQEVLEGGQTYVRYGCLLNKDYGSYAAVESFIEFIYRYAEHARPEDGSIRLLFV